MSETKTVWKWAQWIISFIVIAVVLFLATENKIVENADCDCNGGGFGACGVEKAEGRCDD